MSRTEQRVCDDLLGSGPKTVEELRSIHHRLCTKYSKNIERKEMQMQKRRQRQQKEVDSDRNNQPPDFAIDLFKFNTKSVNITRTRNSSQGADMEEVEFALPASLKTISPNSQPLDDPDSSSMLNKSGKIVDFLIDDFVGVSVERDDYAFASTKAYDTMRSFTIDDEQDLLS
jgi:hypothetical protein